MTCFELCVSSVLMENEDFWKSEGSFVLMCSSLANPLGLYEIKNPKGMFLLLYYISTCLFVWV